MDQQPPLVREDFRVRLGKLKWGISFSWFINFLILALTVEAALIFTLLKDSATNQEIGSFLLDTLPLSALIAAIAITLVSAFSWKSIVARLETVNADPQTQRYLENIVEEMALAAGLSRDELPKVGVIADREPNAFAISGPRDSMIGVTTGLLDTLNREELQGVIAHELGHLIAGDSKAMTKLIAMASLVGVFSGIASRMFMGRNSDSKNPLAIVLIVLSLVFLMVAPLLAGLANASMQRKRESQADAISVKLTRNPSALARALRKIEGAHGQLPPEKNSVETATKQLAFFSRKHYRTHPPTDERIHELKKMGADPSI